MFDITEEDEIERILNPMMNLKQHSSMKKLIFQNELSFVKQMHQRNVCFVIIVTLKMLDLNLNQVFVINVVLDLYFENQKELKY